MGCASSRVPNPDEYLSIEQPAPAEGYLVAGWPSSIKMAGWSYCGDYHAADDAVSTMMMLTSDDPGSVYHETRGAGPGGVGVPEELAITDLDGTPLGTMFMPKPSKNNCEYELVPISIAPPGSAVVDSVMTNGSNPVTCSSTTPGHRHTK